MLARFILDSRQCFFWYRAPFWVFHPGRQIAATVIPGSSQLYRDNVGDRFRSGVPGIWIKERTSHEYKRHRWAVNPGSFRKLKVLEEEPVLLSNKLEYSSPIVDRGYLHHGARRKGPPRRCYPFRRSFPLCVIHRLAVVYAQVRQRRCWRRRLRSLGYMGTCDFVIGNQTEAVMSTSGVLLLEFMYESD